MTQPPPITRSGAQHDARHELAKAIYHRQSDPLAVRVIHAVGRFVDHQLDKALNNAPVGGLGALTLVVVVAVVVAFAIWRVGVPRRTASIGSVLAPGRSTTAEDHRALAENAARDGDWHTAVVERMRAIARELEQRGVLDPHAGRTATELAAQAAARVPRAAVDLAAAADLFNAVAYGNAEATATSFALMVTADDAVRATSRSEVLAQ